MKQVFAKRLVLTTIILMNLLTGMEFDLFVPSFPQLQNQFLLTPFQVEALLSINFVGYFLSLFFVGRMADHYGRKPVILAGLSTFGVGSLLCLWGLTYEILLAGRFLQGIGIAAPSILSFLIIADRYPLKKQQSLFAILNGLFNFSAGAAPVIGSYITLNFNWQGNFTALLLIGLTTLVMTVLFIPTDQLSELKQPSQEIGYIPLFRSKYLVLLIVFFVFNFVPYWVFVGVSPILYMEDLGVSLAHFGYYQGSLAFVYAVGSLIFGLIINRFDRKKLLYVSSHIFFVSLISLGLVTIIDSPNPLFITLAILPFIIGQIIPSNILYPICLSLMPQAKGRITAILQGGRLVFSALCLQIAGYVYQGSFQNIGVIILAFIFLTILTLLYVIKSPEIVH